MKILHLLSGGGIGGIEMLCRDIAELSADQNEFCFLFSGGIIADEMEKKGTFIYRYYQHNVFRRMLKVLILVQKNQYDIVMVHHEGIGIYTFFLMLIYRFRKIKFIKYLHCSFDDKYFYQGVKWKDRLNYFILNKTLQKSDRMIAVSEFVKESYCKEFLIDPKKVSVIYNGIRLQEKKSYTFKSVKPDDPVGILYIGRLVKEKGIHLLLEAMQELVENGENVELYILGDGEQRAEYEHLSEKMGLLNRVYFKGYQLEKEIYYGNAQVFVYPSICQEAFGISIVEALSHGMICVASRVGGVPEIISDGRDGLLFEVNNKKSLVEALRRAFLICRSEEFENFAEKGYEKAKMYSIGKSIDSLKNLYDEMLINKGK